MLIAQITDSHIVPRGELWKGDPCTETDARLSRAIDYLNRSHPRPDVVLFSGDAVEQGNEASYRHFRELIHPLQIPLYMIPGNHDQRELMRSHFSDHTYIPSHGLFNYLIDDYPVRLIGLDTHVENQHFGRVSQESAIWLEKTLKMNPDKPALIFMHHPPMKVGVKTFDIKYLCYVDPAFERVVRTSEPLLGIVAGHYHHLCISSFCGKSCIAAPSLAPKPYFVHPDDPRPAALELDDPVVTFHKWLDGAVALATHVLHLKENPRRIPFTT